MRKIILFFLLLVSVIYPQQPVEVVSIIDPGNGACAKYTSLQAWAKSIALRGADLVARNVIEVARCICTNGKPDVTPVSSTNLTTDATHYIKIYADTNYNGNNYRHKGVFPDSGNIYKIEYANTGIPVIGIITSKVIIDGLAIMDNLSDSSFSGNAIQLADCDAGGYIENCIILEKKCLKADPHGHGIRIDAAAKYSKYYIHNNVISGFRDINYTNPVNCGILTYPTTDSMLVWIDNNTIYDCEYGIWNRGGESGYKSAWATVRNNLIQNSHPDMYSKDIYDVNQFTSASANNVSLLAYTPINTVEIPNSGFEDTTAIEPFSNGNVNNESYHGYPVHSGSYCLELNTGWDSIDIYTAPINGLQTNTIYTLSFYGEYGWGNKFTVSVKSSSASDSSLGYLITSNNDSVMTNHTIKFNSGNNTSVIIDVNGGVKGGAYYFDDFFLFPGNSADSLNNNAYFKDVSNNDFHLICTASLAIGHGINLSLDANDPFNNDIDGSLRVVPWDVGAYQYNVENIVDTPGVVVLLSPNSSSTIPDTISSLLFTWKSASFASTYNLQISSNKNFSPVLSDSAGIADTVFTYHLRNLTSTFYWRVRGSNKAGAGSWSAPMMVQLITGIDDNKNRTPVAYELYQNYPNPFSAGGRSAFGGNPATTIVYSLPNDDHVILKVYNYLAGR